MWWDSGEGGFSCIKSGHKDQSTENSEEVFGDRQHEEVLLNGSRRKCQSDFKLAEVLADEQG